MGINETGKVFRVYQGPELYQVPLPSPYTISIIELKLRLVVRSRGYLSYSAIILWISAVYITCQAASLQCMIKTSTLTGCFILSRFGYRFIEDPVRFRFPVDVSREVHFYTCPCLIFFYIFRISLNESFNPAIWHICNPCIFHFTAFTLLISDIEKDV